MMTKPPGVAAWLCLLLLFSFSAAAQGASLLVSTAASRSNPVALDGAVVNGTVYVFVDPTDGINQVSFYLDDPGLSGSPVTVERLAPYDFAGTAPDRTAYPYDTSLLADGGHVVTAVVGLSGGGSAIVEAAFTVANGVSGNYALQLSTVPDRATPVSLDGATVNGLMYAFVAPDEEVDQVSFFLNDPDLSGSPVSVERLAPYDFAGTAPDRTAYPYDTTQLADGDHVVTAVVKLSSGGSAIVEAAFTVANGVSGNYALQLSTVPNRATPVSLDGATVNGFMYAFVAPDEGIDRVSFYLNDPGLSGSPATVERLAPYDFAGTAPDRTAYPYDTTRLADGGHNISAVVTRNDGSTVTLDAGFTVANNAGANDIDQVHLAWPEDPASTLTIVWRSKDPDAASTVEYRKFGDPVWQTATGGPRPSGTSGTLHQVTLTSLSPATAYEYRIWDSRLGAWGDAYQTRTAPAAGPADFDAVFVADTGLIGRLDGLATGTAQVIDEIAALNPLLVLLGGDYAYYNTDQRFATLDEAIDTWFNQWQSVASRSPLAPTYGNHEAILGEGFEFWAARFPTPNGFNQRRNFSFDVGDVHFISIFAVHNNEGIPSTALDWVEQDILAAQRAGARWIVPYFHVAPFSDGKNHPSNLKLREQFGPLFERLGVKLVLTAHDQAYERTYPLINVPASNTPTSTALHCYTLADGVTWVKISPGGKLSNINKGFSPFATNPPPAWTAVRDNTRHHFARLTVFAAGELLLEAYGVTGDGAPPEITDSFRYTTGNCPDQPTWQLSLSSSPDRSNPVPLAGESVSGDIYVFLSPENGIARVSFFIDDPALTGPPEKVENNAPYDLAGTTPDDVALPFDTTALANGAHIVTARIEFSGGGVTTVEASFTVANGTN